MKMTKKRILKSMMLVAIFMLIILFSKDAYACGQCQDNGSTIKFRYARCALSVQGNVYCVEAGQPFLGPKTYNVSGTYAVTDPLLAYIINMTDQPRTNFGKKDIKQNMIWWYVQYNPSYEASVIRQIAGNYKSNWPSTVTLKQAEIQNYINEAETYANKINGANISITDTKLEDGFLKIAVSASNVDSISVLANGITVSEREGNYYKISLSDLGSASHAIITARGINTLMNAEFQVLYHGNSQTLIRTLPKNSTEQVVTTDTRTVVINTDVSMQKYITKVNNMELKDTNTTTLTNRHNANSTASNKTVAWIEKDKMQKDINKQNNVVIIEAGDYVTYRIWVYNNSNVNASNVTITDTLPTLNGRYSINGGSYKEITQREITHTISNLSANSSQYFDVTVHFQGYEEPVLVNNAAITSTTPNNNTTYRTVDEDYIQMKKYQVSLEKYISKKEDQNTSKDLINVSEYKDIIDYLIANNATNDAKKIRDLIDALIKKYETHQVIENFEVYDLNKDGKVDDKDITISEYIKNPSILKVDIENYLKADLNNDGKVDDKDIDLYNKYTEYKADLNEDGQLNKYDKYAFIAKHLQDKSMLNADNYNDTLTKLYIAKLLKENDNKKENIISKIEAYIKSDVNDDGLVSEIDSTYKRAELITNKINKVTNEAYDNTNTKSIVEEFISKLDSEENQNIAVIRKIIGIFDINEDGLLNQDDIDIYTLYKNAPNNNWQKYKEDMLEVTSIAITNSNAKDYEKYDVDGDKRISFEDYLFLMTYVDESELNETITDDTPEEVKIAKYIKEKLTHNNVAGDGWGDLTYGWYDLNEDYNLDIEDFKIVKDFIKIKEYENARAPKISTIINKNVLGKAIDYYNVFQEEKPNLSIEDIIGIGLYKGFKAYDENLKVSEYEQYDINQDHLINNKDKQMIQNNDNDALKNAIDNETMYNDLLNILTSDYNDFITYLKNVAENKIDIEKVKTNTYDYSTFIQILADKDKTVEKISNILDNKIKILSLEEIQKQSEKEIELLDINQDGIVNSLDTDCYENRGSINLTKELISQNDIDGDGDWDNIDKKILEKIQILKDKSQAERNNIINEIIQLLENKEEVADRKGHAEHQYDNDKNTNNPKKYDSVVTNAHKGEFITYTIIAKNDSTDTSVYIHTIEDYMPNGVKYNGIEYKGNWYCKEFEDIIGSNKNNKEEVEEKKFNTVKFTNLSGILLAPGESASFTVTVEVVEDNISLNILKNTAKITEISNKNGIIMNADEADSTPNDNQDSDYFQMRDITISGTVWNDMAWDKGQKNYNGIYENEKDKPLPDVKVYLYRVSEKDPVATTTTDENGQYTFKMNYIKGPRVSSEEHSRWVGTYYHYYVVFEYDGITYTSSPVVREDGTTVPCADVTSNNPLESNAREKRDDQDTNFDGRVERSRVNYNTRNIPTIFRSISYTTKNEKDHLPESNHVYNPNNMAMQSSTALIRLSKNENLESQLQHVNLGLRGRDIFDLELTNDVSSTKVTVNGKQGAYQYNDNKVTLRRSDISNQYPFNQYDEDMANTYEAGSAYAGEEYTQGVRKSDIDVGQAKTEQTVIPYDETGLEIEVTYKITVQNTSTTPGKITSIVDYYDRIYKVKEDSLKDSFGNDWKISNEGSIDGYKYIEIIPKTSLSYLQQNKSIDIYITFEMEEKTALNSLLEGRELATYNMAEIGDYIIDIGEGQNPFTVGLIDKDSAPGSANKEQVRLTTTEGQNTPTRNGNPTTVKYYFDKKLEANADNKEYLQKLKYEDDTCAAPVLYFAAPSNESENAYRQITGTVFEDKTTTNPTTKVKTGNGKLDKGEVGVCGATVNLIEVDSEGHTITRYSTTTNKDGVYTVRGFLPGNYKLEYHYGNNYATVLKNQEADGINKESYNGEDYQSTNNIGEYGAAKLNSTRGFWYVYNEKDGISTATDDSDRRNQVSNDVMKFTDEQMTVLNNMRDGKNEEQSKVSYRNGGKTETVTVDDIIDKTNMFATTKPIELTVEKTTEVKENKPVPRFSFGEYIIRNMNFGIAEVPVTEINLQKHVQSFTITDSTGKNVIASMSKGENGEWQTRGDVLPAGTAFDVSIEDEKLQGARLEITYAIVSTMRTEKNFDNKELTVPTITGVVDYIDNNLSYNPALGNNDKYWELTNYEDTLEVYGRSQFKGGTVPIGTVDPEGKKYTTIVKAKANNPILLQEAGEGRATITLEKILTAPDATLEQIITSTVESFAYSNTVEITGLDYKNVTPSDSEVDPQRDRIRTPNRYIIIPGVQHDWATSEIITIHPPTGDRSVNVIYYALAAISLIILGAGAFGINKFVLHNKK